MVTDSTGQVQPRFTNSTFVSAGWQLRLLQKHGFISTLLLCSSILLFLSFQHFWTSFCYCKFCKFFISVCYNLCSSFSSFCFALVKWKVKFFCSGRMSRYQLMSWDCGFVWGGFFLRMKERTWIVCGWKGGGGRVLKSTLRFCCVIAESCIGMGIDNLGSVIIGGVKKV